MLQKPKQPNVASAFHTTIVQQTTRGTKPSNFFCIWLFSQMVWCHMTWCRVPLVLLCTLVLLSELAAFCSLQLFLVFGACSPCFCFVGYNFLFSIFCSFFLCHLIVCFFIFVCSGVCMFHDSAPVGHSN